MRCKTCDYSLKDLTEHRCPECGNPFDPNDPRTFASGSVWDAHRRAGPGFLAGFCVCLVLMIWGLVDEPNTLPLLFSTIIVGVILMLTWVAIIVSTLWAWRLRKREP